MSFFQHTRSHLACAPRFKIEIDTAATFDSPFLKRPNPLPEKCLAKTNLPLFGGRFPWFIYWRTQNWTSPSQVKATTG